MIIPTEAFEYCCQCDDPTGRAGVDEDSLYTDDNRGPFCIDCYEELVMLTEGQNDERLTKG